MQFFRIQGSTAIAILDEVCSSCALRMAPPGICRSGVAFVRVGRRCSGAALVISSQSMEFVGVGGGAGIVTCGDFASSHFIRTHHPHTAHAPTNFHSYASALLPSSHGLSLFVGQPTSFSLSGNLCVRVFDGLGREGLIR